MSDSARGGRWQVVMLMGANVGAATGLFVHAFLYNFYLSGLGFGPAAMGWAQASLAAGGLVGLLPAGRLVDRIGARDTTLVGTLLLGAGLAIGALTERILPICVAAAVAGVGTAAWRVASGPLMLQLVPPAERARWFSRNVAALLTTGGVAMLAAGALASRVTTLFGLTPVGAHRVVLITAALCAIAGAASYLLLPRDRPLQAPPTRAPSSGMPETRLAIGVAAIALWMTAAAIVSPFFNLYFRDVHQLDVARIGLLFGISHLATAAIIAVGAEAGARWSAARVLTGWMVLLAPALLALAAGPALAMGVTLYLIQGLVAPATNPLIDVIVLEAAPLARRGAVASWRNAATELSGTVGPAVGGMVLASRGFGGLFSLGAAVALVGAIALLAWILNGPPATAPDVHRRD